MTAFSVNRSTVYSLYDPQSSIDEPDSSSTIPILPNDSILTWKVIQARSCPYQETFSLSKIHLLAYNIEEKNYVQDIPCRVEIKKSSLVNNSHDPNDYANDIRYEAMVRLQPIRRLLSGRYRLKIEANIIFSDSVEVRAGDQTIISFDFEV